MKLIMTTRFLVTFNRIFSNGMLAVTMMALSLGLSFGLSLAGSAAYAADSEAIEATEAGDSVGFVSLVLGKAYIEGPATPRQLVRKGTAITVNDRISTRANGHVHIHFVDDALVSVRPDSRLEILRYDYDAANPQRSAVKFNLLEGVTRAISGDVARSAKERFRLNTPVAAIGVRGTDFVVSASQQTVRALVNEGIIVMSPYSDQCTVESFGACGSNGFELSSSSLEILELNSSGPTLIPASHERDPDMMREEVELAVNGDLEDEETADDTSDVYLENVTSRRLTASVAADLADRPALAPDFTPVEPVAAVVLDERQLMWGRWSLGGGMGDLERITVPADVAGESRNITIADLNYGLFRSEPPGRQRVDDGLGVVGFALSSAQAYYHSDSGVAAMQVNNGSLAIDFDVNQFATELNLDHTLTGPIDFFAAGRIYSGGYFYQHTDTQSLSGAVSLDGTEAGYSFDQQLGTGSIQGLTLWDRP